MALRVGKKKMESIIWVQQRVSSLLTQLHVLCFTQNPTRHSESLSDQDYYENFIFFFFHIVSRCEKGYLTGSVRSGHGHLLEVGGQLSLRSASFPSAAGWWRSSVSSLGICR